jgi:hypothetical protein
MGRRIGVVKMRSLASYDHRLERGAGVLFGLGRMGNSTEG